jgi:hypothetical protein
MLPRNGGGPLKRNRAVAPTGPPENEKRPLRFQSEGTRKTQNTIAQRPDLIPPPKNNQPAPKISETRRGAR